MYALYIITFQYIIIWLDSPSFNCKLTWAIHLAVSYFDTQDHGTNSPHQLRNEGLIPALSTIMSIFWNSFTSMPCYPPKGGREASWKLGWKVSKLKFSKNTCSLYIYIYLYILLYYIHLVERGCSSTDSKASKNEEIWKDFEKIATRASLLMSPKQLDPNIETDQLVSVWGWWNPPSKLPDYSELMLLPIVYLATHLSISATSTSFCLTKNMQRSQIPYRNNHVYNSMQKWIAETNPRKDNEAFHLTLSHSLSVSYLSLSLSLSPWGEFVTYFKCCKNISSFYTKQKIIQKIWNPTCQRQNLSTNPFWMCHPKGHFLDGCFARSPICHVTLGRHGPVFAGTR